MFIPPYWIMVKSGEEQAFLNKTMRELMGNDFEGYAVDFVGYQSLGTHTYGQCAFPARTRCAVSLGAKYPWDKRPLFRAAVLYHEACHAKLYLEDGKVNGHDEEFRKLRRQKPLYWIADMIMKFVWSGI